MNGGWIVKKKWFRVLVVSVVSIIAVLWTGGIYLSSHVEDLLRKRLSEDLPKHLQADFSSLAINLFKRSAEVKNLRVQSLYDSVESCHPVIVTALQIRLKGIDLIDLLFRNTLQINNIAIDSAEASYSKCSGDANEAGRSTPKGNLDIRSIYIGSIDLEKCHVRYYNDSIKELDASLTLTIENISIPSLTNVSLGDISFGDLTASITDIHIAPATSAYVTQVANCHISGSGKGITIDTIRMQPRHNKFDFSRRFGKQIDRFEVMIPTVRVDNFNLKGVADSTLTANSIHIYNATMLSFRDKRMPFVKHHTTKLPAALLNDLPYRVRIDTLKIYNSFISYEEYPAEGDGSGAIEFHQLDASGFNIANRPTPGKPNHIDLDIRTMFMGAGLLTASFDIPIDPSSQLYFVKGSLTNFELPILNPALHHLAMIRIPSGIMNSFEFDFTFNNNVSNGAVVMNYEKLKVVTLEEKKAETEIDKFKTFLLNTFIIKRNKDESMVKDKRTGIIHYERDKKRSVFNFLWKSLLSGIKASYNLSDLPLGKNGRKTKKNSKKKRRS